MGSLHPILGAKLSGHSMRQGVPRGWGALPGAGRAESGSLGLSQPQPGVGQPGLMGTAQAKAGTEHQSTDHIRIKILYLPVLNFMKIVLV